MSRRDEAAASAFGAAKPECVHALELHEVTSDTVGLRSALCVCALCGWQQVILAKRATADG